MRPDYLRSFDDRIRFRCRILLNRFVATGSPTLETLAAPGQQLHRQHSVSSVATRDEACYVPGYVTGVHDDHALFFGNRRHLDEACEEQQQRHPSMGSLSHCKFLRVEPHRRLPFPSSELHSTPRRCAIVGSAAIVDTEAGLARVWVVAKDNSRGGRWRQPR